MAAVKQESLLEKPTDSKQLQHELAQLRAKVADLSSLIEVSIIINSILELDELVSLVMEKAQTVMRAEASSVMLLNEETNILECEVALGDVGEQVKNSMQLKVGEGVAGWVAKHGKPQIVPDVLNDPHFTSKVDDVTGFQTRSILAAPLIVKDKIIGVAEVINRVDGKAFNEDDLQLFSTFCRQVAMAIENVRMHQVEVEKQKLEQQLEAAKFIQQSFMPESFPKSPGQRFSIAAKSIPATSVGGDFYDVIDFDDGTIGVAVGDVAGKGVPAALYMARLVSDLRTYSQMHRYPGQVLEQLNNILVERSRRGMFVTFQYGLLDPASGEFKYSNAGHIPFIRANHRKREIELLKDATSVPLGILPQIDVGQESVQLDRGDCIVLVTDGIIEAKNHNDEEYSLERVMKKLSKRQGSVDEVVNRLIADVQEFSNHRSQFDDLTILAFRLE